MFLFPKTSLGYFLCCLVRLGGALKVMQEVLYRGQSAISMLGASSTAPSLRCFLAWLHNIAVLLIMSFIFSFNIKERP